MVVRSKGEVGPEECVGGGPALLQMLSHSLMTLDVGVLITVLGAIGAVFAWVVDQRAGRQQERRQRELALIERQLRELYGPLFSIVSSSKKIYEAFHAQATGVAARVGKTYSFTDFNDGAVTPEVAVLHRRWIRVIMVPQWEEIERCIRDNGDLVIEPNFPDAFAQILTHIASWRLLVESWVPLQDSNLHNRPEELKLDRNFAAISFPKAYQEYVSEAYARLRRRQSTLLLELHPRGVQQEQGGVGGG